jgi:hypothetical protein
VVENTKKSLRLELVKLALQPKVEARVSQITPIKAITESVRLEQQLRRANRAD